MFKKRLSMIFCTSLLALALVACGGSSEGQKETKKEGNNTQIETKDETKTETETEAKEVTLTVFDGQAYGLDRYAELVKSFEEAHPGVKVEVQHASSDGMQLLNARINSNDTPDIMALQTGTTAANYYEFAYDWTEDAEVLELTHWMCLANMFLEYMEKMDYTLQMEEILAKKFL